MIRRPLILALAFAAASATACGPKKQPQPPVDSTPTADPDPPKPPPPKCEKLDEKCEGGGGKKARVANIPLVFEPIMGWVYAQGEKATIAQTGDETAGYALAGHDAPADPKDAKKLEQARQAQLEALAAELGITLGRGKVNWKSAAGTMEAGPLKLEIWELKDVTRGTKKGDIVVIAGAPADGKALLAIGFVPKDDDQSGEKIMKSFETLAAGEAPK